MKLVFAHDHRFLPLGGNVYSDPQFSAVLWERYLAHFKTVTVVGRRRAACDDESRKKLARSSASGVEFALLRNLSSLNGQFIWKREEARRMAKVVEKADAVVARLPSEIGLLAAQTAQRLGRPWAVEVVACPFGLLQAYGNWQGKVYAPVMAKRMQAVVARAPFALYVTRFFLQQRYPCRGVAVCCSDVEIPEPSKAVLDGRLARIDESDLKSRPLVLGLIGSLATRRKGIQTVFAALARRRSDLPPVVFRILGGGDAAPWRREAERAGIADLVQFDGTLPTGDPVLDWLDRIDIYLQPSLTEGLPRALIEAMSRGCPAIASATSGIPELLDSACLIRPKDDHHLAALLSRAMTDKSWRATQAERNWAEAGNYSVEALRRRRDDFWRNFAGYATHAMAFREGSNGVRASD